MGLKRGWFQNEFLNYKKSWEPAWLVKKVSSRVTLELFWEKNRKTVGRDGWFLLTPALNRVKEHLENLYGTCECCVRNMWGQCFLKRFGDFSINLSITIENLEEYSIPDRYVFVTNVDCDKIVIVFAFLLQQNNNNYWKAAWAISYMMDDSGEEGTMYCYCAL